MRIVSFLFLAALLTAPACKSDGESSENQFAAPSGPLSVTWSESGDSFDVSNGAKGWVKAEGIKYRIKLQSSVPMTYSIGAHKGSTNATFEVELGAVIGGAKISAVSYLAPTEPLHLESGEQSLDVKLLGLNYRENIPTLFAGIKDGPILFAEEPADAQKIDSALWLHKDFKVEWDVLGQRGTYADIDWIAETKREDTAADSIECEGYQAERGGLGLVPTPDAKVNFEMYNTGLVVRDRRSAKVLHTLSLAPAKACPEKVYTIERDGQHFASIYLQPDEIKKKITELLASSGSAP
jgi:hypothetical protein